MAPAARWFVVNRVAVFAVGRDARGIAASPPSADFDRVVLLNDFNATDEELRSVAFHEFSHAFLQAPCPRNLSRVEESLYATDGGIRLLAAHHGLEEELVAGEIRDEQRACALAARWGATGLSVDAAFCTAHLRAELLEIRTRKAREAHERESS
jgi:hypothetical protein